MPENLIDKNNVMALSKINPGISFPNFDAFGSGWLDRLGTKHTVLKTKREREKKLVCKKRSKV